MYNPVQESRQREISLQRRNEELAVQIGVLIAKNHRMQETVRVMQREKFAAKLDTATQTSDIHEVPNKQRQMYVPV